MKYIFGPVASRRLGISLGIDIVPYKTCTFNCIYCECGKTTNNSIERKPYIKAEKILKELQDYLKAAGELDYITLTGSGEPTLNSEIGLLIKEIKNITKVPIAVLTNGSLLYLPEVRKDLLSADLIIPSLDTISSTLFLKIDRPHEELNINQIIKGLIAFRKEFKGLIWLEIFFVKDINDRESEIEEMIRIIKKIKPDKIQLNTIDRPPTENLAEPCGREELELICKKFKNNELPAEIVESIEEKTGYHSGDDSSENQSKFQYSNIKEQIINLIKRRPETARHLADTFGVSINYVNKILQDMQKEKLITIAFPDNSNDAYYAYLIQ